MKVKTCVLSRGSSVFRKSIGFILIAFLSLTFGRGGTVQAADQIKLTLPWIPEGEVAFMYGTRAFGGNAAWTYRSPADTGPERPRRR